jgi:hypothetical protein
MILVQALESEWPPFSSFRFSLTSSVNSQTKTSKVRDDKLGGGDHFSAAEKCTGRIVDIIGLAKREHCALLE